MLCSRVSQTEQTTSHRGAEERPKSSTRLSETHMIDVHGVRRDIATHEFHVEMRQPERSLSIRGGRDTALHRRRSPTRSKSPYPRGAGTLGYGDNWDSNNVVIRALGQALGLPEERTYYHKEETPFERFNRKNPPTTISDGGAPQPIGFHSSVRAEQMAGGPDPPSSGSGNRLPGAPFGKGGPKMSRRPRWLP